MLSTNWQRFCLFRQLHTTRCLTVQRDPKEFWNEKNRKMAPLTRVHDSFGRKWIKTKNQMMRKYAGFPSEQDAPHIKAIFESSSDSFLLLYNPIIICSLPPQIYKMFDSPLPIYINLALFPLVGVFMWCCLKFPSKMYYDEKEDKTTATFVHPFIPGKFRKVDMPHGTFNYPGPDLVFGNGSIKIYVELEDFVCNRGLDRLISQNETK